MKKNKRIMLLCAVIALAALTLFSVGAGKDNGKIYKFNVKSNDMLLDQFKNNDLTVENDAKFGKGKEAQLKIDINLEKDEDVSTEKSIYHGSISGKLKLKEEKIFYDFSGSDDFLKITFDNRTVYIGNVSVQMQNKKTSSEEAVFGIRFEPETNKIDVAVTSGAVGETAFLPFGEAFLSIEDWNKIDAIHYGE